MDESCHIWMRDMSHMKSPLCIERCNPKKPIINGKSPVCIATHGNRHGALWRCSQGDGEAVVYHIYLYYI